jgi:hypothetical protein
MDLDRHGGQPWSSMYLQEDINSQQWLDCYDPTKIMVGGRAPPLHLLFFFFFLYKKKWVFIFFTFVDDDPLKNWLSWRDNNIFVSNPAAIYTGTGLYSDQMEPWLLWIFKISLIFFLS